MADKDYQADAARIGLPVGRPVGGDDLQKIIAGSLEAVPPDVVSEYLTYTESK